MLVCGAVCTLERRCIPQTKMPQPRIATRRTPEPTATVASRAPGELHRPLKGPRAPGLAGGSRLFCLQSRGCPRSDSRTHSLMCVSPTKKNMFDISQVGACMQTTIHGVRAATRKHKRLRHITCWRMHANHHSAFQTSCTGKDQPGRHFSIAVANSRSCVGFTTGNGCSRTRKRPSTRALASGNRSCSLHSAVHASNPVSRACEEGGDISNSCGAERGMATPHERRTANPTL